MKSIAILGSTGSVGVNTLDLVRRFPDDFTVRGLVAGRNLKRLASQIKEFSHEWVSIQDKERIPQLRQLLKNGRTEIYSGQEGASRIATSDSIDVVIAAIVGGAGLVPTFEAVRAGKEVALANKEALVMAGEIFVNEAKQANIRLFPVHSEHSAIFQCPQGNQRAEDDTPIITPSAWPLINT